MLAQPRRVARTPAARWRRPPDHLVPELRRRPGLLHRPRAHRGVVHRPELHPDAARRPPDRRRRGDRRLHAAHHTRSPTGTAAARPGQQQVRQHRDAGNADRQRDHGGHHRERFDLVTLSGGNVALRSKANGQYVCAENAGAAPADRQPGRVGALGDVHPVTNSDGTVSLRATANNRYVAAENAGAAALIANRDRHRPVGEVRPRHQLTDPPHVVRDPTWSMMRPARPSPSEKDHASTPDAGRGLLAVATVAAGSPRPPVRRRRRSSPPPTTSRSRSPPAAAELGEAMSLAVLPNRSVLHTARNGTVRVTDAAGNTKVAGTIPVYTHDEEGMQGVAVDPNFATNRWIYLYYSPHAEHPGRRRPDHRHRGRLRRRGRGTSTCPGSPSTRDDTINLGSEKVVLTGRQRPRPVLPRRRRHRLRRGRQPVPDHRRRHQPVRVAGVLAARRADRPQPAVRRAALRRATPTTCAASCCGSSRRPTARTPSRPATCSRRAPRTPARRSTRWASATRSG